MFHANHLPHGLHMELSWDEPDLAGHQTTQDLQVANECASPLFTLNRSDSPTHFTVNGFPASWTHHDPIFCKESISKTSSNPCRCRCHVSANLWDTTIELKTSLWHIPWEQREPIMYTDACTSMRRLTCSLDVFAVLCAYLNNASTWHFRFYFWTSLKYPIVALDRATCRQWRGNGWVASVPYATPSTALLALQHQ